MWASATPESRRTGQRCVAVGTLCSRGVCSLLRLGYRLKEFEVVFKRDSPCFKVACRINLDSQCFFFCCFVSFFSPLLTVVLVSFTADVSYTVTGHKINHLVPVGCGMDTPGFHFSFIYRERSYRNYPPWQGWTERHSDNGVSPHQPEPQGCWNPL